MNHFVYPSGSPDPISADELFGELLSQADDLATHTPIGQQLWVSGALASWRDEFTTVDPAATDAAFLAWLRDQPEAEALTRATRTVLEGSGGVELTEAWALGHTLLLAGRCGTELFSVLAELDEERTLLDLRVGPPAEDLVEAVALNHEEEADDQVTEIPPPVSVPLDRAVRELSEAWNRCAAELRSTDVFVEIPETLLLNQGAVRSWLSGHPGSDERIPLDELHLAPRGAMVFNNGMSDAEIGESNAWASGVLRSALRRSHDLVDTDELVTRAESDPLVRSAAVPLGGPIGHLHHREQQALCWLEWADWLGVIIGLARSGAGVAVTAESMLSLLTSSQEVTSDVPTADREWLLYAFGIAVSLWSDAGVVVDGQLTVEGADALPTAALWVWRPGA